MFVLSIDQWFYNSKVLTRGKLLDSYRKRILSGALKFKQQQEMLQTLYSLQYLHIIKKKFYVKFI